MAMAIKPQSISGFLKSRDMKILYHWVVGVAVALVAFFQLNASPFVVGLIGLVWFYVVDLLIEELARRNERSYRIYFLGIEYELTLGVPFVAVLVSLFVYMPFPVMEYHVLDKGDVVLHRENPSATLFNPFVHKVRMYGADQSVPNYARLECKATTADDRGVKAHLVADLALPFEGLPTAYAASGSRGALTNMVHAELCNQFARVIGGYALAQIPRPFVLASNTANDKSGMNKVGVRYTGTILVGDIQAYVAQ